MEGKASDRHERAAAGDPSDRPVRDDHGCCGSAAASCTALAGLNDAWVESRVTTPVGDVPRVATRLRFADQLGTFKARWGLGRMHYRIEPGLYAVGAPAATSPVLVTANYKMSFDRLRSQLSGRDAWILVLETEGINVWCAAGKGTFGTDETVRRVQAARLDEVVSGRTLIVPQLGAPGVNAHEVRRQTGFRVVYGPVRAEDLPAFLDAGMEATPEMRRVRFSLWDRAVLVPVELVMSLKYALIVVACLALLGGLGPDGYSIDRVATAGLRSALLLLAAYLTGAALTPLLLPWVPGRAFSAKGALLGLVLALGVACYAWTHPGVFPNRLSLVAWLVMIPTVASFLAMGFTGASTYTSQSGVRREMALAVPIQVLGAVAGIVLWTVGRFV